MKTAGIVIAIGGLIMMVIFGIAGRRVAAGRCFGIACLGGFLIEIGG